MVWHNLASKAHLLRIYSLFSPENVIQRKQFCALDTYPDCFLLFASGLGGMPKAKSVGYAKLALAEQLKKDEVIVEVCEKATETTPSLLDFQDEELDEDFYLANDFDEVDYFYHGNAIFSVRFPP